LNLVRLLVSYHLHIYRLVSVVHRINAAFGVSNKFVPYRPPYDTVIDAVNHYKSDTTTTIGTDWTLTSIVLNAPTDAIVSLTACATWGAKAPRGIRVTRSNTSATDNIIINTETDTDKAVITASGIVTKLNGNNTYYVWAKAKETATLLPVHLQYSYLMKS
jgi:hypothetical protein